MTFNRSPFSTSKLLSLTVLGQKSIGRYELSKFLDISIAKTRSMLISLINDRLAYTKGKSSGKTGTSLTEFGHQLYDSLSKLFMINFEPHFISAYTDLVPIGSNPVILLFQTILDSITGIYERDTAVRCGADGAITLIKKKGNWQFPDGFNFENSKLTNLNIPKTFNCCIIVFSNSIGCSANGAIQIAEYHLYDEILKVFQN